MKLALIPGVGSDDLCMSLLTQPLLGFSDEVKGCWFFFFPGRRKVSFTEVLLPGFLVGDAEGS